MQNSHRLCGNKWQNIKKKKKKNVQSEGRVIVWTGPQIVHTGETWLSSWYGSFRLLHLLERKAEVNHILSFCCFTILAVSCLIRVLVSAFGKACTSLLRQHDPVPLVWPGAIGLHSSSGPCGEKRFERKYFFQRKWKMFVEAGKEHLCH